VIWKLLAYYLESPSIPLAASVQQFEKLEGNNRCVVTSNLQMSHK